MMIRLKKILYLKSSVIQQDSITVSFTNLFYFIKLISRNAGAIVEQGGNKRVEGNGNL